MKERLRSAVHSVAPPPYLEARIRSNIRASQPHRLWGFRLLPIAAAVVICIGATVAYQLGHLRYLAASQETYLVSLSNQVASIMRVGLGDHVHCAVFRKYPKTPPTTEDLAASLGPKYSGLMQIVHDRVPKGYQMMLAHECRYHGRKFVHLALTNGGRILSLVVAVKGEGESFETAKLVPALSEAGIPVYRSGVQHFQIAAFESRDHLVYVISDMPQQKNMDLLLALAPGVKVFLEKLES